MSVCYDDDLLQVRLRDGRTQIHQLVQLFSAEHHVLVAAELDSAELQDVVDLPSDDLQRLRVTHQVIHGPEGGGDRVPH